MGIAWKLPEEPLKDTESVYGRGDLDGQETPTKTPLYYDPYLALRLSYGNWGGLYGNLGGLGYNNYSPYRSLAYSPYRNAGLNAYSPYANSPYAFRRSVDLPGLGLGLDKYEVRKSADLGLGLNLL